MKEKSKPAAVVRCLLGHREEQGRAHTQTPVHARRRRPKTETATEDNVTRKSRSSAFSLTSEPANSLPLATMTKEKANPKMEHQTENK